MAFTSKIERKAQTAALIRERLASPEVKARMRAAWARRRAAKGLPPVADPRIGLTARLKSLQLDADVEELLAEIISRLPRK